MTARKTLIIALAASVAVAPSYGQAGLPVIDKPRYAILLNDIKSLDKTIKSISSVVGAAKSTIDSLGKISDGIRDLQGEIKDGVRGLAGDLSDSIGLTDILGTLQQVQSLYDDTQSLLKEIHSLPDDAKKQLADIGFATNDVKDFLKTGLVYDTFNRLGVDDWKQVV